MVCVLYPDTLSRPHGKYTKEKDILVIGAALEQVTLLVRIALIVDTRGLGMKKGPGRVPLEPGRQDGIQREWEHLGKKQLAKSSTSRSMHGRGVLGELQPEVELRVWGTQALCRIAVTHLNTGK